MLVVKRGYKGDMFFACRKSTRAQAGDTRVAERIDYEIVRVFYSNDAATKYVGEHNGS